MTPFSDADRSERSDAGEATRTGSPVQRAPVRPTVLACRDLWRTFATPGGALEVLRGVELEVRAGSIVAILGPSGSGKTTLLHLLAGLDRIERGEVLWSELPVHASLPRELARHRAEHVGLVFQDPHLLADLDARENVLIPGRIVGAVDPARADALLAAVGLAGRADAFPATLSGGERQRVALARALVLDPPLVLADEPTGSLDRTTAHEVFAMLVRIARERGTAVVMVTHDEGLVREVDARYRLIDGVLAVS